MKFLKPSALKILEKQTDASDPRLKHIIKPLGQCADVGIVGIPFDLGVTFSGGRSGAERAPSAIRWQLKKYGTAHNLWRAADLEKLSIADCGDIIPPASYRALNPRSVYAMHNRVTKVLELLYGKCDTLITLGGGNDLSFATVRALANSASGEIAGINVDAHLDMRETINGKITSGTPYRRLIERGIIKAENLSEFAVQGHVNSKANWDWAVKNNVRIITLQGMRRQAMAATIDLIKYDIEERKKVSSSFISIDIDSVAQAFAPGSSAPNPDGLFPNEILELAYMAGKMKSVKLFEIMEVNPMFDEGERTARLAANIIAEFLAGYANRQR